MTTFMHLEWVFSSPAISSKLQSHQPKLEGIILRLSNQAEKDIA